MKAGNAANRVAAYRQERTTSASICAIEPGSIPLVAELPGASTVGPKDQFATVLCDRLKAARDRRKQIVAACIPKTRLRSGELFADIVADRRDRPPLFLSVVQRQGSTEILFLGQYCSRLQAELAAKAFLSHYHRHRGENFRESED